MFGEPAIPASKHHMGRKGHGRQPQPIARRRPDARTAVERDIQALRLKVEPFENRREFYYSSRKYVSRFTRVLRKHGHRGPLQIELQDDAGRILASGRELLRFSGLIGSPKPRECNLALWSVSLVLGGTRGFRVKGGPGHWRVILGRAGGRTGQRCTVQSLGRAMRDPDQAFLVEVRKARAATAR